MAQYRKCLSCRLFDSLLCRDCKSYSLYTPIVDRKYYFINTEGKAVGPVEAYNLPYYGINQSSYVWTKGMSDWVLVSFIPELFFIPKADGMCNQQSDSETVDLPNKRFLLSLASVPLLIKIVYLIFLSLLLLFITIDLYSLISIEFELFSWIFVLGISVSLLAVWGIYTLIVQKKESGFWLGSIAVFYHLIVLSSFIALLFNDYEGTLANPTLNDIATDNFYVAIGGLVGSVVSIFIMAILWIVLFIKKNGESFKSELQETSSVVRCIPVIFFVMPDYITSYGFHLKVIVSLK